MTDPLDLSVIIVTYNASQLIGNCLNSLAAECRDLRHEVFVVDSGSSDNTAALIRDRFPAIRLHESRLNIGFSAGNNIALPQCRGRYIVLLNPDTIVHPGALRQLMRHLDGHRGAGAAGPTLRLGDGQIQAECARNLPRLGNLFPWLLLLDKVEWALRYGNGVRHGDGPHPPSSLFDRFTLLSWSRDRTCEVESICGACMMFRREVVERVGLLDEASPLYLDDIDYCRRIRKAGWQVHYVAGAEITHLWKQSSSASQRDGDFYAMGIHAIWLYLRKHDGRFASAVFAAMALVAGPLRLLVSGAAAVVARGPRREFWQRQLTMALGLNRWAFRFPKSPPRFGFASETNKT